MRRLVGINHHFGLVVDDKEAVRGGAVGRRRRGRAERRPAIPRPVLNFSALEYMNSGGIGLLVTLLVRARRQDQQLLAYGLSAHYRQIFELTRLDEAVAIHGSEAEALGAAGAG